MDNINLKSLLIVLISIASAVTDDQIVALQKPLPTERTIYKVHGTKADLCSQKPCVRKCCGINNLAIMMSFGDNSGSCISKAKLNVTLDLPDPTIYTKDLDVTGKEFKSSFEILSGWTVIRDGWLAKGDFYLTEDGTLIRELPNIYDRFKKYDVDNFCIDFLYKNKTNSVDLAAFIMGTIDKPIFYDYTVSIVGMIISSAFILITIVLYACVPRLRSRLHGRVAIAFCASLLGFYLTQLTYQLVYHLCGSTQLQCHIMGLPSYFLLIATFCWLNVIYFNIWYDFRNMKSKTNFKEVNPLFWKYLAYGLGLPFVMTAILAFLNYLPMDKIDKSVVTPGIVYKTCFIGGTERFFYIIIPSVILVAFNGLITIATVCTIYRLRGANDTRRRNILKLRFFAVSFIFMAITLRLIFETIQCIRPNSTWRSVADALNGLIGVIVFIAFVCNKRTFNLIKNRKQWKTNDKYVPEINVENKSRSSYEALPTEIVSN